jgi:hypothetical protein
MCPHATICVLILLYMCPHNTTFVSSYDYMCPHATICVLILQYVSSYYICVLMLLYMCPHITMCPHTTICVLILLYICVRELGQAGRVANSGCVANSLYVLLTVCM